MDILSLLSKLGLPSSVIPEGWRIRVEFENDAWLVSVVSPFGEEELIAARCVDRTIDAVVKETIQRAQKKVSDDMARRVDPRVIYRLSECFPTGDWWWMYDARMHYWKKWEPGWCFDSCWTHWSPASLTPPQYAP